MLNLQVIDCDFAIIESSVSILRALRTIWRCLGVHSAYTFTINIFYCLLTMKLDVSAVYSGILFLEICLLLVGLYVSFICCIFMKFNCWYFYAVFLKPCLCFQRFTYVSRPTVWVANVASIVDVGLLDLCMQNFSRNTRSKVRECGLDSSGSV
jgi:hypothetical protein